MSDAVVTVCFGDAAANLDRAFLSFRRLGLPLVAFVIGKVPRRYGWVDIIQLAPDSSWHHPLREVYFRRMELIDTLPYQRVLVVDAYDVLCLQDLPSFESILDGRIVAGVPEHDGGREILGQGFTSSFINCGVLFWDVGRSVSIRAEIVARGRRHFRTIADDQICFNEVIHTHYPYALRVLPSIYNYRPNLGRKQRGIVTVNHLHGVKIYHNSRCLEDAKAGTWSKHPPMLKPLPQDGKMTKAQLALRRMKNRIVR